MTAGTMELNMNEMEMVNGGRSLFGCMIASILGAGKGALTGGAAGMVIAGPPGAVVGAVTMAILKSGMSLTGIDGFTQAVVKGVMLIAVVAISFDRKNAGVIK